jgi:hypothetical protein
MLIRGVLPIIVLSVAFSTAAKPAMAQDNPSVQVSGGYNVLHLDVDAEDPEDLANLPVGWYADVVGNVTNIFGVVGQASGNYKTVDTFGVDVDTKIHTFMGGVRVGGGSANVKPFGQLLFGAARLSASSNASGLLPFDISDSETDPAIQFGAGVNVMADAPVGVRIGGAYTRVYSDDERSNAFSFNVGLVFGR